MKGFFIGLILGAIATWCWFQTGGKIHITETKTITNEVVVTITETQTVEQVAYQYITKTNEVWKTNMIEKIARVTPVAAVTPVAQKTAEQARPVQATQPATIQQVVPAPEVKKTGLRGATSAGKVEPYHGSKITSKNTGVHRDFSGNIITNK